MKKRHPQEIADFFDCYVAQDGTGHFQMYSEKPTFIMEDHQFGVENVWCMVGKPQGRTEYITSFVDIPEGHDFHILYEPSKPDKAPHQSQVYTHGEYMIVRSPSRDTDDLSMLESGVMIWVRAGWKPIGGVTFDKKGYPCQAMVRGL